MSELIRMVLLLSTLNAAELPTEDRAWRAVPGAAPISPVARAPEPADSRTDAWLGSDKVQHFWMSYATAAFGFAAVSALGQDPGRALNVGLVSAAAAGLGKEFHDHYRGWTFSVKDLVADALGLAAAYFFLREVR
jgi:uncharacterized protein YfiM (DUF2279 family)